MAQPSGIRVKVKYRDEVKVTIMSSKEDRRLCSIVRLEELIFRNFPDVERLCEGSSAGSNFNLDVQIEDEDGDLVSIDNDGDLKSVIEWGDRSNFLFLVDVKNQQAAAHDWSSSAGSSSRAKSGETPARLHKTRGKQPCRLYNLGRGTCKFGSDCRFSHDRDGEKAREHITARSSSGQGTAAPAKIVTDYGTWLRLQYGREASDNVTTLSRDEGFDVLAKIVEETNLSGHLIELLVKLLSREEFRFSLMREQTNKVYGLLIGSSFLVQLHGHITRQLPGAQPQDVRSYLMLIEELTYRTTDGWKEVPLDAISSVIQKLEGGSAKAELVMMVNLLIEHRNKLHRQATLSSCDADDNGFLDWEFRSLSLVPDKEELLQPYMSSDLPVNLVGKKYSSIGKYLETHFRLLREDCIEPLRQGIRAYRNNQPSRELRIYLRVKLVGYRCGDEGVEYVVAFTESGRTNCESKRLFNGALVCLSSDGYRDSFIFGVVTGTNFVGKGGTRFTVQIRVMGEPGVSGEASIVPDRIYVMVESATAYFEAYYHVLKSLQRADMEDVPFKRYLLDLEREVEPPFYLRHRKNGDVFDFGPVFPSMKEDIGRNLIHVLQDWPPWPCTLDGAQLQALKHGLTKELSIIQGPPGTGKTFLGLLLVELLLANFQQARPLFSGRRAMATIEPNSEGRKGPILVICKTNHALDQFLEGIYKFEKNLIRIGARSQSKVLQERNLKKVREEERSTHGATLASRRTAKYLAYKERGFLEEKIHECISKSHVRYVEKHDLTNIATDAQIRNLFCADLPSSKQTVRSWLAGDVYPDAADPLLDSEPGDFHDETLDGNNQPRKNEHGRVIMLTGLTGATDSVDDGTENRLQVQRRKGRKTTRAAKGLPEMMNMNVVAAVAAGLEDRPPCIPDIPEEMGGIHRRDGDQFQQETQEEMGRIDPRQSHVEPKNDNSNGVRIEHIMDYPDVWNLNAEQRKTLHKYWLDQLRVKFHRELQQLTKAYEQISKTIRQRDDEFMLSVLRKANVVGITTTTAARYRKILKALNSEILIVEEAAEVLESHILPGLSPCIKHLVLIGDHLQLRPSTAVYQLGTKHKLDVSMFERLVQGGVEHVTLQEQRRMRPSFSNLVRSLYPKLKDHESVSKYENISGVTANLLFFHHTAGENSTTVDTSKVNTTEAKLVVELTLYLMKQECYSAQNIAILTMYSGQLMEIKKLLKERAACRLSAYHIQRLWKMQKERPGGPEEKVEENDDQEEDDDLSKLLPRVSSVDDFQGEESDIIILSLVRSNDIQTGEGEGTIGFLKTPNRVCVALTRAKKGMYIFGNATLLAKRSSLWKKVTGTLRKDNALATKLELVCPNHPDMKTVISKEEDFKQVAGEGCSRPCRVQLECGHVCPRRCHPGFHDSVLCSKPCLRGYSSCLHACTQVCHGSSNCPPCQVRVNKSFRACGHSKKMECCTDPADEICRRPCPKLLECLHKCPRICGAPCPEKCVQKVVRDLPCGHPKEMECCTDPADEICKRPCPKLLECLHKCPRICGAPCTEKCVQKVARDLPCGHPKEMECCIDPADEICKRPCPKLLECLHKCSRICGAPCTEKCVQKVARDLPCGHPKEMECRIDPADEICKRPCPKLLECLHKCSRICGAPCTEKCVQKVARELACGHSTQLPCHLDALTYSCTEPCRAILSSCEHTCQGTCGMCKNGREHISCSHKCDRTLPCGHVCEAACPAPCPPCQKKCQRKCFHSRCQLPCGEICEPCRKPCPWQCEHHKCRLLCHEICRRPRCNLPCKNVLKCGHPCIGLCGEPCPTKCRVCHPKSFDIITQTTLEESKESDRFLQMQDCHHLFEVTNLDTWMDSDNTLSATIIKPKECPQCKLSVWRSMRYGNVIRTWQKKLEGVKKKMLGYEKTRQGQLKLDEGNHEGAYENFCAALQQNPVLMDAHFGAGIASCSAKLYARAAVYLSFIVRNSSYAAEVTGALKSTVSLDKKFGTSKVHCSPLNDELGVKAMLQLASVFTAMQEFTNAYNLCNAVIKRQPDNSDALEIKKSTIRRVLATVVQAMSQEVGERGQWFQCPNGHYYTECEGVLRPSTQQSVCLDCQAGVGRGTHADVDRSTLCCLS